MKKVHSWFLLVVLFSVALPCFAQKSSQRLPNVVVIFIDDMGYADIGPFGAEGYSTPHLAAMAAAGMRFTDFEVSSAVCSASRAALLTGCYHQRVGISGALGPKSDRGINSEEITLAELCKQQGYATACFGKWHLGHHPKFLPTNHGFDEYYGLPYSNDMWPFHPFYLNLPPESPRRKQGFPPLPLIENTTVIDSNVTGEDQTQLTTAYTERAVSFINRNHDKPFFLYLPHSMVHVPLYVSEKFKGKSERGLFGDVVMEVDWSVGQIIAALKKHQIDDNTIVIFTSDNGPWLSYGDHAGSSGPLREGKGTMFEGGSRVPTIVQWPNRIPAGTTCDELASTIDILPTVANLIGADLPAHPIDGQDISDLLFAKENAQSPHESFLMYYAGGQLQAVRDRRWKLHFPHRFRTMAGRPGGKEGIPAPYSQTEIGLTLFDLKTDIAEKLDVSEQHPEIVQRLQGMADAARTELGDSLTKQVGEHIRPAGKLTKDDDRLTW
ncbi:MAG: sulfatase [Planctomycetaceae bacterium]|nr:sulfatase [Planctomycetaceae bacterium]